MPPLTALRNWVIPACITFEFNQILTSKQQLKTHILTQGLKLLQIHQDI